MSSRLFAQELVPTEENLGELNIEQLLQVTVATREPISEAKAPGIITVISREEIKNSGARNLPDLLTLVPGFQFVSDYNGTLTLGVRGLLAVEGKVLLMVDGVEMNELLYNAILFSYAYPVEHINRIEVVRGPGSVIYGSTAEYAVINVITMSGEQMDGLRASTQLGSMEGGVKRETLSVGYGTKHGEDPGSLEWKLHVFGGAAGIGAKDRTYPYGPAFSAKDYRQAVENVNASLSYEGLSAKAVVERTTSRARDAYGAPLVNTTDVGFYTYATDVEYRWDVNPEFSITPTYSFKHSLSYNNDDPDLTAVGGDSDSDSDGISDVLEEYHINNKFDRHRIFVPARYRFAREFRLLAGVEYYQDRGEDLNDMFTTNPNFPNAMEDTWTFETTSAFAEFAWDSDWGALSLGGRHEHHSYFGDNFVPRFSWTRNFEPLNFKVLVSEAYRNPSIGNLNYTHKIGATVNAEKTKVYELETTYRFSSRMSASVNLFHLISQNTIVYDPTTYGYVNGEQTASQGAELQFRQKEDWGFSNFTFSSYDAGQNKVARYAVTENQTQTIGFASAKATWNAKYLVAPKISLRPSVVYLGERFAFSGDVDADFVMEQKKIDAVVLANLIGAYEDVFVEGLDVTFGAMNLFDQNDVYPSGYDFGRDPLPAPTREILLGVNYAVGEF